MTSVSLIVVFFIIWLVVFFIFLPIGIKIPKKIIRGNATSAPENSNILKKLFFSFIAAIFLAYLFYQIKLNFLI
mgnify:FL=1|jgi:predicted secreted protein|tara:strand:- start:662 stop:883 length:222 start_codon:yes stop_codon:yes gene_type:complete